MVFNDTGIIGWDVSLYQRIVDITRVPPLVLEIDFARMKAYGTDFVIIKAGQHTYADPGFAYNWEHAKINKISRGSYWFEDKDSTPESQAIRYWDLLKNDPGEGVHAVDFELGSHHDLDSLYRFINEFQQRSGLPNHKIAIYTGYYYWVDAIQNAQVEWFRRFPLWLAWYSSNPYYVNIPYPWTELTLWQDGTPSIGLEVGVRSREIDRNRFNGDRDKFRMYFDNVQDGDKEMADYYEVRSTNTAEFRTIRSGPRVTFPAIGTMTSGASSMARGRVEDLFTFAADSYDGTVLKAKAGDQWVHVYEVNGVARDGWMAVKHLGVPFTTLKLINTTPSPSEEYILHVKDGVTRRFDLSI